MDSALIPEGVRRCSFKKFALWVLVILAFLGWGLLAGFLVLWKGLNQTGLNDYFGFGLWITADLGIIALGAGAFFTGFLTYVIGKKELKDIINLAVVIGFICYTGAQLVLLLDIGQPLRGWFTFWHPNVHSMLTEVVFCITCYTIVLVIEYLPLILENRVLDRVPEFHYFSHNLHEIMVVFAATGTFLSFFHQGSLGGLYGVLFGRPFAFREGFFIWPWTFFLFVASAIASGPALTILVCYLLQEITRKKLVRREVLSELARITGYLLAFYMVVKIADTWYWASQLAPSEGFNLSDFYMSPYGKWLLVAELGVCGVLPALMLLCPWCREDDVWLLTACVLDCTGILLNRFVFTVQTLAVPVLPFDQWQVYIPTWQEWAPTVALVAYGALLISLSYRYLPMFPREKELNPSD
ncbi:MAG: polysulfide reductase NrfD [Deltaproteobacteria bacterium]|nr:polysulfide reductase NrfD [Deltaproteobacteria bacterium]MBW2070857.1 polysulfide reductase NrfD [Deltaproteobacteria bacterium]